MKLNMKHRLFIEAYDGDIIESMTAAGFEGHPSYLEVEGAKLLRNPTIIEGIRQRKLYMESTAKVIANREERQAFWTSIMRNEDPHQKPKVNDRGVTIPPEDIPLGTRLKASELLGKSETDFIERMDVNHNLSISDVIKEAYTVSNESLDEIEVQYERQYSKKKAIDVVADEAVSNDTMGCDTDNSALDDFI